MSDIYFAGGCFWGIQHLFEQAHGVTGTQAGYANGHLDNPTYEQVYTDKTGHAETVKVTFDEEIIGLDTLLKIFFMAIDPVSVNKQGEDSGTRYRTGIYYSDPKQKDAIEAFADGVQQNYFQPLVVEILPLKCFFPAEDSHQFFLDNNPNGYCHLNPGLFELVRRMTAGKHQ